MVNIAAVKWEDSRGKLFWKKVDDIVTRCKTIYILIFETNEIIGEVENYNTVN